MTDSTTESEQRGAAYTAIALLLFLALCINVGGAYSKPVQISINGAQQMVSPQLSVAEAVSEYDLELATPGDLLDVDGEVLEDGGGNPPIFTVNGKVVDGSGRVRAGSTIRVSVGTNQVESTQVQYEHAPVKFQRKGEGPMPIVTRSGQTGIIKLSVGDVSGKVASSSITREAVDAVVEYARMPDPKLKIVALTFDDGPNPGETDKILKILKKEKVKATFFFMGKSVDKHPEIVQKAVKAGHQIGAHSQSHRSYTTLNASQIEQDVLKSIHAIERACGVRVDWVRPPYGAVNGTVYSELDRMSLRVALWSIDPKDWSRPGFQKIINRVVFGAHPGAVVLFHDGGGDRSQTVKALPGIIGELRDAGYRFVTMEEYAILADEFSKGK